MKIFNINFIKKNSNKTDDNNKSKDYDPYGEIGKLLKEARIQNNLSVKELSNISKIPESSIQSIENNIKDLRPKDPFLRSILLKLEKCLFLKNNALLGLVIKEVKTLEKDKKTYILRKIDFLNYWQVSFFYFLFLILMLFLLNRYFISNINIIEIQIIEEKEKEKEK
tara:strand:- start:648 stop:1148 length:501 start_codon:yes stop_codon:yes gene_type:complete